MIARVTWDPAKAAGNVRKHGIPFDDARTVFHDPLMLSIDDHEHSDREERYLAIGESINGRLIVVSYAVRDEVARLITARHAEPAERRRYMRGDQIRDDAAAETIEEVDFSNGVRGRHYIAPRGPIVVEIEAIVAEYFRDAGTINQALRMLIAEGRSPDRIPAER